MGVEIQVGLSIGMIKYKIQMYFAEDIPAGEWREYSLQLPEGTSRIFVLGGTYSSIPGESIGVDNMCIKSGKCGEVEQSGCDVSIACRLGCRWGGVTLRLCANKLTRSYLVYMVNWSFFVLSNQKKIPNSR